MAGIGGADLVSTKLLEREPLVLHLNLTFPAADGTNAN